MQQLHLDTWAFVRLMVALEEAPKKVGLLSAWAKEWEEVDAKLSDLSQSDFDSYSTMMMESQIELDLEDANADEFKSTLKNLIAAMKSKRGNSKDAEFKKDLDFEIEGLSALL